MTFYVKGANAERELIRMFFNAGFSVARVAGSGSSSLPCPDLIALSKNKKFAFECKAWKNNYLHIDLIQFSETLKWSQNAGLDFLVAWKIPRKGWLFLKPNAFRKTKKFYAIKLSEALKKSLSFDKLVK